MSDTDARGQTHLQPLSAPLGTLPTTTPKSDKSDAGLVYGKSSRCSPNGLPTSDLRPQEPTARHDSVSGHMQRAMSRRSANCYRRPKEARAEAHKLMIDVARWLAELGLAEHADAFAANGISGDILHELSDGDLKELGLTLGYRKRLLKAIAGLDKPVPTAPPVTRREAERRQLTVMFVDLVGSTALSSRLDPETMREVLRRYQNVVAGEVSRFEGLVAKLMGDGVLAYFGWPRAHEDDAERAVRASLAAAAATASLTTPAGEPLAARIGVATGLVVVGDLVGEGSAQEEAVVGETPNLAARLQEAAVPGTVVVADGTRRLLGGVFDLRPLGPIRLKGFARPVEAFRVAGER